MTALLSLLATGVSLAAIGCLAATDPERRRAFGLPRHPGPRRAGMALAGALLPGPVLLLLGDGAAFVVWLGAISVAGWSVAALSPDLTRHLARRTRRFAGRARVWTCRAVGSGRTLLAGVVGMPPRVAQLEARVAELEEAVRTLRAATPPAGADPRPGRLPGTRPAAVPVRSRAVS